MPKRTARRSAGRDPAPPPPSLRHRPLLPLGAALGLLPGALAWAALPGLLGIPAVRRVLRHYDAPDRMAPANALTIAVHLATCVLMGLLLLF